MKTNNRFLPQYRAEKQKLRKRYIWVCPLAFLGILLLWLLWMFRNADARTLAQGYTSLFYQLPMINAILMPILLAVIASRLCDMEIKGHTLKLLYTLQKRNSFYHCKYLFGIKYLAFFVFGEFLLILLTGKVFSFTETFPVKEGLLYLLTNLVTGMILLGIQQTASLLSDNQIFPLALGLVGSFLGLFSMFFPKAVSRFIIWGYFAMFTPIGMSWDSQTRITDYYAIPFPLTQFLLFCAFGIILYFTGKYLCSRKEV